MRKFAFPNVRVGDDVATATVHVDEHGAITHWHVTSSWSIKIPVNQKLVDLCLPGIVERTEYALAGLPERYADTVY